MGTSSAPISTNSTREQSPLEDAQPTTGRALLAGGLCCAPATLQLLRQVTMVTLLSYCLDPYAIAAGKFSESTVTSVT
jgi:hypothetical protein